MECKTVFECWRSQLVLGASKVLLFTASYQCKWAKWDLTCDRLSPWCGTWRSLGGSLKYARQTVNKLDSSNWKGPWHAVKNVATAENENILSALTIKVSWWHWNEKFDFIHVWRVFMSWYFCTCRYSRVQPSRVGALPPLSRAPRLSVVPRHPALRHGLRRHSLRAGWGDPQGKPQIPRKDLGRWAFSLLGGVLGSGVLEPGWKGEAKTSKVTCASWSKIYRYPVIVLAPLINLYPTSPVPMQIRIAFQGILVFPQLRIAIICFQRSLIDNKKVWGRPNIRVNQLSAFLSDSSLSQDNLKSFSFWGWGRLL